MNDERIVDQKEAMEYLFERGRTFGAEQVKQSREVEVTELYKDENAGTRTVAVQHGDDPVTERVLPLKRSMKEHSLHSLVSLIAFLNRPELAKKDVTVFANRETVKANLGYAGYNPDKAIMAMKRSQEFRSLVLVVEGVTQKKFHELLRGDMNGCFKKELLVALSSVRVSEKGESECKIIPTGMSDGKSSNSITIQFMEGDKPRDAEIHTEWVWMGRPFENWDQTVEIKMFLDIQMRDGHVIFRMIPSRVEAVLDNYMDELAAHLDAETGEHVRVYSGRE